MTLPRVVLSGGGITNILIGTASTGSDGSTNPSSGTHDPDHLNVTVEQAGTYSGVDSRNVLKTTGTVVRLWTVNCDGGGAQELNQSAAALMRPIALAYLRNLIDLRAMSIVVWFYHSILC